MTVHRGLFIHSLIAHLGCLHLLGIVNNAAVNVHAQVLCGRMFSFVGGTYLGLELLDYLVTCV